jgi:hypothetical protein
VVLWQKIALGEVERELEALAELFGEAAVVRSTKWGGDELELFARDLGVGDVSSRDRSRERNDERNDDRQDKPRLVERPQGVGLSRCGRERVPRRRTRGARARWARR